MGIRRNVPARRTLEAMAGDRLNDGCEHGDAFILHHDHLIDEALWRIKRHLRTEGRSEQMSVLWPDFLRKNDKLFHKPKWVCRTCNEQDALLKGSKGSAARMIPRGMSLDAQKLSQLANVRIANLNGSADRLSRKAATSEVRRVFERSLCSEFRSFWERRSRMKLAVTSV